MAIAKYYVRTNDDVQQSDLFASRMLLWLTNELRGVAADLLPVENMDSAQAVNHGCTKSVQWHMDDLFLISPSQSPPACAWRLMTQQSNV